MRISRIESGAALDRRRCKRFIEVINSRRQSCYLHGTGADVRLKGEVPDGDDFTIPLGVADIKREGTDCTIVARSMTVPIALQAADKMKAAFDVSVEVVDPRTIKPLDIETIVNSVKKTNRLVIAEESHSFASVGAEIAYQIMDGAFDYLDAR
jgi:pyruvate dehydrogenase E1 component beta subunit